MSLTTARDLMVPLEIYPHALESQTLAEAITLFETAQIDVHGRMSMPRVLLVLDIQNQLVGMVRRRDILRGIEPEFPVDLHESHPEAHVQADIDPNLLALMSHFDPQRVESQLARPIGEVVTDLEAHVDIDDPLMMVVREMVGNDMHIAVVLDDGKVAGVVRSLDVLHALAEQMD